MPVLGGKNERCAYFCLCGWESYAYSSLLGLIDLDAVVFKNGRAHASFGTNLG